MESLGIAKLFIQAGCTLTVNTPEYTYDAFGNFMQLRQRPGKVLWTASIDQDQAEILMAIVMAEG